jgi:hypothetical protein
MGEAALSVAPEFERNKELKKLVSILELLTSSPA